MSKLTRIEVDNGLLEYMKPCDLNISYFKIVIFEDYKVDTEFKTFNCLKESNTHYFTGEDYNRITNDGDKISKKDIGIFQDKRWSSYSYDEPDIRVVYLYFLEDEFEIAQKIIEKRFETVKNSLIMTLTKQLANIHNVKINYETSNN